MSQIYKGIYYKGEINHRNYSVLITKSALVIASNMINNKYP